MDIQRNCVGHGDGRCAGERVRDLATRVGSRLVGGEVLSGSASHSSSSSSSSMSSSDRPIKFDDPPSPSGSESESSGSRYVRDAVVVPRLGVALVAGVVIANPMAPARTRRNLTVGYLRARADR